MSSCKPSPWMKIYLFTKIIIPKTVFGKGIWANHGSTKKKHWAPVPKRNVNLFPWSLHASMAFGYWSVSTGRTNENAISILPKLRASWRSSCWWIRGHCKHCPWILQASTRIRQKRMKLLSISVNANSELTLNHRIAISNRLQTLRPHHIGGQISLVEISWSCPSDLLLGTPPHRCVAFESQM